LPHITKNDSRMLKLLVTGLMVYLLYRYFFGANAIGSGQREEEKNIHHRSNANKQQDDDGDYIDYEEVD
jgi:hypothetical protein